MWSYKYTSSASTFTEHYRVGVRLEAVIPAVRLVEIFAAVTKEQVTMATIIGNKLSQLLVNLSSSQRKVSMHVVR